MNTKDLFSLSHLSTVFTGYFLDTNIDIWSVKSHVAIKSGSPTLLKRRETYRLNGVDITRGWLQRALSANTPWIQYLSSNCHNEVEEIPEPQSVFLVCIFDESGVYKFSYFPVVHSTEESARKECERLASTNPELSFAYFEKKGMVTMKEVKTTQPTWD